MGACSKRSPFLPTGIWHIQPLSTSEMSSFLPLDCTRVKLALVLIKTCRHLELGPQKPVTPPTLLSQASQPSLIWEKEEQVYFRGGEVLTGQTCFILEGQA